MLVQKSALSNATNDAERNTRNDAEFETTKAIPRQFNVFKHARYISRKGLNTR